jgi:dihydroorotase
MFSIKRRQISAGIAAAFATGLYGCATGNARAAMGPNDKFDLVIKGGEVLDPSQGLRGKRDIGMRFGVIEAVEADIPAARANRVMNAAGRLVVPGLIDLHSHVYTTGIGIPADELVPFQGTTTAVSAGDAGSSAFALVRRAMAAQSRTRLYAFVHIANIGLSAFPIGELFNIDFAQTEAAAKTLAENADIAIGIKVRMSQNVIARHGLEPLKRAIRACEIAGTGGKVMCHIGGVETVELMTQILETLRPGDILTHCFSGAPQRRRPVHQHRAGRQAAAGGGRRQAARRDVRHRPRRRQLRLHGCRDRARRGRAADTLSSDIHVFSGNSPGLPYLTNVMGKFMALGHTLEQVVTMATATPARIINRLPKHGTLQVGAPGDATVIEVQNGPVEFVDTRNNKRQGQVFLKPTNAVIGGIAFGQPYQSPFSVR